MLLHEDVLLQLVDLPPVAEDYLEPWMSGTLHGADAVVLVVDLSDPACVDQLATVERRLEEKKVTLVPRLDAAPAGTEVDSDAAVPDPFRVRLPAILLANKADLFADPDAELAVFRELAPDPFESLAVSAETGRGLAAIGPLLVVPPRDRPRLLQGPGPPARLRPAVHAAPRRDGPRGGAPGPPRPGRGAEVRAHLGAERRSSTASR